MTSTNNETCHALAPKEPLVPVLAWHDRGIMTNHVGIIGLVPTSEYRYATRG